MFDTATFELLNVNLEWVPPQEIFAYTYTELLATLAPRKSPNSLNSVYFVFICQQYIFDFVKTEHEYPTKSLGLFLVSAHHFMEQ